MTSLLKVVREKITGSVGGDNDYYMSLYNALLAVNGSSPALLRDFEFLINMPKGGSSLREAARKDIESKAQGLVAMGLIPPLDEIRELSADGPVHYEFDQNRNQSNLKG